MANDSDNPQDSASPGEGSAHPDAARLLDMLRSGEKIAAIRLYREKTGCSLVEAKSTIEALAQEHGIPQTSGCSTRPAAMIAVFGLLLVAGGLYWLVV